MYVAGVADVGVSGKAGDSGNDAGVGVAGDKGVLVCVGGVGVGVGVWIVVRV